MNSSKPRWLCVPDFRPVCPFQRGLGIAHLFGWPILHGPFLKFLLAPYDKKVAREGLLFQGLGTACVLVELIDFTAIIFSINSALTRFAKRLREAPAESLFEKF